MCTMAAVINRVVGSELGTRRIAQFLNTGGSQSDASLAQAFGAGDAEGAAQQQAVLNGMIRFIKQACSHEGQPVLGYQAGFYGHFFSPGRALVYMKSKPVGTAFAVWGCHRDMPGLWAHWNFATTMGHNKDVVYIDYQDNTNDATAPYQSPDFIAPRNIRDESPEFTSLIVLSFERTF